MLHKHPIELLKLFQIPFLDTGGEFVRIKCPFHADHEELDKVHGGISKSSGAFKCMSCGAPSNVVAIIATLNNVDVNTIVAHSDNILGTQGKGADLDPALVEMCHTELLGSKDYLSKLINKHGINASSVTKYRLGYYSTTKRITIPIYDRNDSLVNIRQYKYDIEGDEAKLISPKGAKASIYLLQNISAADEVIITEGEFKAILLNQEGFNAVASTGGANTFPASWCELFKGKKVVIIYDVDAAGRRNATKIAAMMVRFAASVKDIVLTEVNDIANGDITDYFVKKNHTKEELRQKIDSWPELKNQPFSRVIVEEEYNEPIKLNLASCAKSTYSGKLVSTEAVVSAKDTAPYVIPAQAHVVCNRDKDVCQFCPVYQTKDKFTVSIPRESKVILELIKKSEKRQDEVLKGYAGIPDKCNAHKMDRIESFNVEEVRLVPQIAIGHSTEEQVTRKAYYVGTGIACNTGYSMSSRACSEPEDSHATLVVYNADPMADDITNFVPSSGLSIFSCGSSSVEAIESKLNEIYTDFSNNVTRIHRRPDLHLFYDLIYHTGLFINFQGRQIKGWGDALVIGDSGQGKSECSSRLMEHYRAGERVDSKRASVAGIVGGLQETSNRWFITWGTIPLNDRRLVILEEAKGMGAAELSKMTDMRSSGVAEIVKIERAKTHARTRLIWISNPRSDSQLSSYNYGVDAVKELIGALEDIRRFDMVMAVCSGDVPQEIINQRFNSTVEHKYTSDLCSNLIGFAWSRKADDIYISVETEQEILDCAIRMGNTYSSACPIVEPSDQRLKLCRLSVALAIRLYSVGTDGKVWVTPSHVKVVENFLNRLYRSKGLGYYEFSMAQKQEETIADTDSIDKRIRATPNCRELVQGLLEADLFHAGDIANFTEYDLEESNAFIGVLARGNCIKRSKKGGYRKTPAFIELLKKLDRSGELVSESLRVTNSKDKF